MRPRVERGLAWDQVVGMQYRQRQTRGPLALSSGFEVWGRVQTCGVLQSHTTEAPGLVRLPDWRLEAAFPHAHLGCWLRNPTSQPCPVKTPLGQAADVPLSELLLSLPQVWSPWFWFPQSLLVTRPCLPVRSCPLSVARSCSFHRKRPGPPPTSQCMVPLPHSPQL